MELKTTGVFRITLLSLRCFGLYPPENASVSYYIYSFLLHSTVTVWFPVSMIIDIFFVKSAAALFANASVAFADAMCSVKTLNAFAKREELQRINKLLERLDERVRKGEDQEEQTFLLKTIKIANRIFITYFIPFAMVALTCELPVIFSAERRLLYPSWQPFDWRNSSITYYSIIAYQFIAIYIQIYQNMLNDVYPGLYLWVLRGHFRTLSMRVAKIGHQSSRSSAENYIELMDCVLHHKIILEYRDLFEKIFSGVLLVQFFITEVTLCATAIYSFFLTSQGEAIYTLFYFICMTMEIWLPCYCGNEIVQENENFRNSLYSCNWMDQERRFKQILIIVLQRSQKSILITAGGILGVSLSTFLAVLRTAYSLFAIVQRLR